MNTSQSNSSDSFTTTISGVEEIQVDLVKSTT